MMWETDTFKFETTKYYLARLEGVAGMRVGTVKTLIENKAKVAKGRVGALTTCEGENGWLMLINENEMK